MSDDFEFHWTNNEANWGPPAEYEEDMGTHFTIEILLKHDDQLVMVRRPDGYQGHQLPPKASDYPEGCLYFCHDLPRWGASLEEEVNRIVDSQIGVDVADIDVLDLEMHTYPDELHEDSNRQWAITLYVLAELEELPDTNDTVTEVVPLGADSLPEGMGWWDIGEMEEFLEEHGDRLSL